MHESLENYLKQVERQLAPLPAERRAEELREIRLHLQMIIDDFITLGDSREEATVAALRQFGTAGKLGRGLSSAHGAKRAGWRRLLLTGVVVAGIESVAFLLGKWLSYAILDYGQFGQLPIAFDMLFCLMFLIFTPAPGAFVAGSIAERMMPRRALPVVIVTHVLMAYSIFLWPQMESGRMSGDEFAMFFAPGLLFALWGAWVQRRRTLPCDQSTSMLSN